MARFTKMVLIVGLVLGGMLFVGAGSADAGYGCYKAPCHTGYGYGYYAPSYGYGVKHYAPVHICKYKVFINDCGYVRCCGTYTSLYAAKHKLHSLRCRGYYGYVKKFIY